MSVAISEQERLEMLRAVRRQQKEETLKSKDGHDAPDYGAPACQRRIVTCPETGRRGHAEVYPDGRVVIQWGRVGEFRNLPAVTECQESDLSRYNPEKPSEVKCDYHLGPDEY